MNLNPIIASNLKFLRTERQLSLGQLAELSGVSKVMLAQIEKGDSNPTINTIWKISNGLKVPYTALIDEPKNETLIVTRSDAKEQFNDDKTYRIYCYFTTTPTRNFELFSVELDPSASYDSIGHSAKSQEYILVVDGELTLVTNHHDYLLRTGDSICFDSSLPHSYINAKESILKLTVLNYYPFK